MKSHVSVIDPGQLRQLAEERLALQTGRRADDSGAQADARALLHSLDLYRVELEIQQEHLMQANRLLQESHDRYADLFHSAPLGHLTLDSRHCITDYNRAAAGVLGIRMPELPSVSFSAFIAASDIPLWQALLMRLDEGSAATSCELRLRSALKGDARRWVRIDAAGGGDTGELRITLTDIGERKALEERTSQLHGKLMRKEKMEALGALAGGVAHDFNNLLQVMLANVELMQDARTLMPDVQVRLDEMQQAIERSMGLASQLLAFARKQPGKPVALDVDASIGVLLGILERVSGEQVELLFSPGAPGARVPFDPVQFDQVLMNLAGNASRAMEGSGSLFITTGLVPAPPDFSLPSSDRALCITVRDTGKGMEPATLERIFEPFFTTEQERGGTGLGLSTVYGIIERHQGTIEAESEAGKGSTFTIHLPLAPAPFPRS